MSPRKIFALAALLLAVGCVWWLMQVREEVNRIEIVTGEPAASTDMVPDSSAVGENVLTAEKASFFAEYRLQRESTRAREMELLNQLIENEKVSGEVKKQAEQQLLSLIGLMEKELLVENMVKAKGYRDAVFFYRVGLANVVVEAENLSERDVVQLAEMVSGLAGIRMEEVAVVEHGE